jgi:spore coat polysaccharide biosynthesis protein SpsF
MKVVAIIQARMGSQRLPGKSLMEIAGKPLLWYVIERVKKAKSLDSIILATSTKPENNPLCHFAEGMNVEVFRGSELDVLSRYVEVGKGANADIIVRICADNPLVDPEEIDRIVYQHISLGNDYSFNHVPSTNNNYPDGFGAEVVNAPVLYSLSTLSLTPEEREHVTLHITRNPGNFSIRSCCAPYEIMGPDINLDIDTPEDFERMKNFIEFLPQEIIPFWTAREIVKYYRIFFKNKIICSVEPPL